MAYLSKSILSEEAYPFISKKIYEIERKNAIFYDFSIHGVRMKIFRDIFHEFKENGYFRVMGFSDNLDNGDCSLTRMVLSYLYWDEFNSLVNKKQGVYEGAYLKDLITKLSRYRKSSDVAKALYGLSLFANKMPEKKEALNAWGNLITYKSLNIDLDESAFYKIIEQCVSNQNGSEISIGKNNINISTVRVKLSDAGMCFAQHYIRSFEFLVCRNSIENNSSLFFVGESMAKEQIDGIIKVLEDCINKIIMPSKDFCCLWKEDKCKCNIDDRNTLFSCNLFLRYQECLDLIRENIWYVDRYRVAYYIEHRDDAYNIELVDKISALYGLYGKVVETVKLDNTHDCLLSKFLTIWNPLPNMQHIENLSEEQRKSTRMNLIRPIQSYFSCQREDAKNALVHIKENPCTTFYDALKFYYNF